MKLYRTTNGGFVEDASFILSRGGLGRTCLSDDLHARVRAAASKCSLEF
jgi:hypothetical protein